MVLLVTQSHSQNKEVRMFTNIVKFIGLLVLMYFLTFIPFGIYVNTALVLCGLWSLVK